MRASSPFGDLGRAAPPNKAMKLKELSVALLRDRSAASCLRRTISDAGTAPQLVAGVGQAERKAMIRESELVRP
jgi:hypothetical protein